MAQYHDDVLKQGEKDTFYQTTSNNKKQKKKKKKNTIATLYNPHLTINRTNELFHICKHKKTKKKTKREKWTKTKNDANNSKMVP